MRDLVILALVAQVRLGEFIKPASRRAPKPLPREAKSVVIYVSWKTKSNATETLKNTDNGPRVS